jgi:superoxide dismutase, Fe-Mn family
MTKRREFLRTTALAGAALWAAPFMACSPKRAAISPVEEAPNTPPVCNFSLPDLGYAYTALEPAIDALTMEIHHSKHHAAYVKNLNAAMADFPSYKCLPLEVLCESVSATDLVVRNNGGGHYNHSLFWNIIKPGGSKVPGPLVSEAIQSSFGSFDAFKTAFAEAAKTRFGSGWAWLCLDENRKLFITSTANQDNPLMKKIETKTGRPILALDVWEHAYYLKYQNKRPDYIQAFMDIINWDTVEALYKAG